MAQRKATLKKKNVRQPRIEAHQLAFLAAYAETCSITSAARAAKLNRSAHYDWLASDEEYRKAFAKAHEQAADALEDEAVRRAHEGTEKPITVAGERELVREYSDTLLIFLLKAIRPAKYRERFDDGAAGGGGVVINVLVRKSGYPSDLQLSPSEPVEMEATAAFQSRFVPRIAGGAPQRAEHESKS
jgi:hypothetical protein